jgi:anti-sigma factor RsiW
MECREAREHLAELNRGWLSPEVEAAVRTHATDCASCGDIVRRDVALHALMRERLPRYAVPPALRARLQGMLQEARQPVRANWKGWLRLHPWTTSVAAGAMAALLLTWAGSVWLARDPVSRLVALAVNEHTEYKRETMNRPIPDPARLLADLRSQAPFALGPIFAGDPEAALIAARTVTLRGKPAAALVYRNAPQRYTTLLLMRGAEATIPAEDRLPIETFKPYHRVASGKQVLYWKQGDVACLMVSDLDPIRIAAMFLKVRKAA